MSKIHLLPVKPYIWKFLQKETRGGTVKIYRRMVRVTTNKNRVDEYFEKMKDSPYKVPVEVRCSSLWVLHAYALELSDQFLDKMCTHIAIEVKKGNTAMQALRDFLAYYEITDEFYDQSSGYRHWMRYKDQYMNPVIPADKVKQLKISPFPVPTSGRQLSLFQS